MIGARQAAPFAFGFIAVSLSALVAKYYYFLYLPESRLRSALSPFLLAKTGAAAAPEILFALAIFAALALLALAARPAPWRWFVVALSLALTAIMICANVAGAETVRIYGMDPKIGMVIYSDFFFSENGRTMIASFLPRGLAVAVIASVAIAAATALALRRWSGLWKTFVLSLPPLVLILAAVALANLRVDAPYKHSPSLSFFASLRTLDADALQGGEGPSAPLPVGPMESAVLPRDKIAGISNVVVVVIESAAAEYFGAYGSRYEATPEFDRLAARRYHGRRLRPFPGLDPRNGGSA